MAIVPTAMRVYRDDIWIDRQIAAAQEDLGIGSMVRSDLDGPVGENGVAEILESDVVYFWGGNTYYLLDWVRKSGLADKLSSGLGDTIYVGASAGSMIVGLNIDCNSTFAPDEEEHRIEDLRGLCIVPFVIIPHMNDSECKEIRVPQIESFAETVDYPIYAMDNDCAVRVVDGEIEIIGGGEYLLLNT